MVDPVVVNRGKIRRLAFHQRRRNRMNSRRIAKDLREHRQIAIALLIDLRRVRNETAECAPRLAR